MEKKNDEECIVCGMNTAVNAEINLMRLVGEIKCTNCGKKVNAIEELHQHVWQCNHGKVRVMFM